MQTPCNKEQMHLTESFSTVMVYNRNTPVEFKMDLITQIRY